MKANIFIDRFESLPLKAQREVIDFIDFLQFKNITKITRKHKSKTKLFEEKFVGIWKDRKDFEDSSEWVKTLRKKEW